MLIKSFLQFFSWKYQFAIRQFFLKSTIFYQEFFLEKWKWKVYNERVLVNLVLKSLGFAFRKSLKLFAQKFKNFGAKIFKTFLKYIIFIRKVLQIPSVENSQIWEFCKNLKIFIIFCQENLENIRLGRNWKLQGSIMIFQKKKIHDFCSGGPLKSFHRKVTIFGREDFKKNLMKNLNT